MSFKIDIVTVFHNERNYKQHLELREQIAKVHPEGGWRFIGVDNREINRGFARACNLGAFNEKATAPIIGFLNPDCEVYARFIPAVEKMFEAGRSKTVITGCRYGKAKRELDIWGVHDWVCGAAMFVRRKWFTEVGGFDEQFVWGFEETDLIRRAERAGLRCESTRLPIKHSSPTEEMPEDAQYKRHYFELSGRRYHRKWKAQDAVKLR